MKYFSLLILLLIIFVASCKVEIDMEPDKLERKIVINSILYADSSIRVCVTKSQHTLEYDSFNYINNAEVEVYENGVLFETLKNHIFMDTLIVNDIYAIYYNPKKVLKQTNIYNYYGTKKLNGTSNKYSIKVKASGLPTAQSIEVSIPEQVKINKIDTTSKLDKGEWDQTSYMKEFQVEFNDNPEIKNYYFIAIQRIPETDSISKEKISYNYYYDSKVDSLDQSLRNLFFINSSDIATEVTFDSEFYLVNRGGMSDEMSTVYGSCFIFSDNLFNGKKYTFKFNFETPLSNGQNNFVKWKEHKLTVKIYSIDQEYYRYIKSMAKYNESNDNFMSEKVNVYNNIKNGMGFAGAANCSVDTVKYTIPDYVTYYK